MTPFEFVAIWGAIAGSASVSFLIYQTATNKPKLIFEVVRKAIYPAKGNNNFSMIIINMKVHNRGSKPTTIHKTKLTFDYDSQSKDIEDERSPLEVLPDRTETFTPNSNIHEDDYIIHDKITNCVLTVEHTHGKNVINLGTIKENKD